VYLCLGITSRIFIRSVPTFKQTHRITQNVVSEDENAVVVYSKNRKKFRLLTIKTKQKFKTNCRAGGRPYTHVTLWFRVKSAANNIYFSQKSQLENLKFLSRSNDQVIIFVQSSTQHAGTVSAHVCLHACLRTSVYTHVCARLCLHACLRTSLSTRMFAHVCLHACLRTSLSTRMFAHFCLHACLRTSVYTQVSSPNCLTELYKILYYFCL
jgi:hypothetical protein